MKKATPYHQKILNCKVRKEVNPFFKADLKVQLGACFVGFFHSKLTFEQMSQICTFPNDPTFLHS